MDDLMREGLVHRHSGIGDDEFFKMIDNTGGWPLGYQYVGFEHTEKRAAGFCTSPHNSGWWTVLASADDYYLWKLSPKALQRIADAVRERITISYINADHLRIKNWRGHTAAVSKTPPASGTEGE